MSAATVRRLAILEPISIFALIMAYIWGLRYRHPGAWLAILGLLVLSHLAHREGAKALGFDAGRLRECLDEFSPVLLFLTLLMLASGLLLRTTRPIRVDNALLTWAAYLPWALFQQYILNAYFLNRLDAVFSPRAAPVAAAALFSASHLPNPLLMAVALFAGYWCSCIYRKYNNLYFLGIAHATVGFLLFLVVPDSISHHLTVGPGWFAH